MTDKEEQAQFIVAEITKHWMAEIPIENLLENLLSQQFEVVINTNFQRGYRLVDWKMNQIYRGEIFTETIIAIFELRDPRWTAMPKS